MKDTLERLRIPTNMKWFFKLHLFVWNPAEWVQLQLEACHLSTGEQFEAKGHFAIVNSCGFAYTSDVSPPCHNNY